MTVAEVAESVRPREKKRWRSAGFVPRVPVTSQSSPMIYPGGIELRSLERELIPWNCLEVSDGKKQLYLPPHSGLEKNNNELNRMLTVVTP